MGVCVSGIEGLGAPPAPPAEEALTAEHKGAHPSLPPPTPSSTSLLTSLLLSHLLHLSFSPSSSIYSLLFRTYRPSLWLLTTFALIFTFPFVHGSVSFLPFLSFSLSSFSLPLTLFKSFHYLSLILRWSAGAGHIQCLLTVTTTSTVCFLFVASEVGPLSIFLFIPKDSSQKPCHFLKHCRLSHQFACISCRTLPYMSG